LLKKRETNMSSVIKTLINIANFLDERALIVEANRVDKIIRKLAFEAGPMSFKTKQEGDRFRAWVVAKDPAYADSIDLDPSGSHTNWYIEKAWKRYGGEFLKENTSGGSYWGGARRPNPVPATQSTEPRDELKSVVSGKIPKSSKRGKPSFGPGDKGAAVKIIQTAVGTAVDGDYGPNTSEAVRLFQKQYNLNSHGTSVGDVPGIVGKLTAQAILSGKTSSKQSSPASAESKEEDKGIMVQIKDALTSGGLPIYARGFAAYLMGRTAPWTNSNMTSTELATLKELVVYSLTPEGRRASKLNEKISVGALINYGVIRGYITKGGGEYSAIYSGEEKKGVKGGIGNMHDADKIAKFLGAANPSGGAGEIETLTADMKAGRPLSVNIVDRYDFNEKKTANLDDFLEDLSASWELLKDGSSYEAVRKLASWRQSGGYSGYPVSLKLSISPTEYQA
jgi:peptidoglycan hydrolase-like protein with peptidoglycan-binding domain